MSGDILMAGKKMTMPKAAPKAMPKAAPKKGGGYGRKGC
jgi:hypothetical protein